MSEHDPWARAKAAQSRRVRHRKGEVMRRWWKQKRCKHSWKPMWTGSTQRKMSAQVMECRWCGKTGVLR